MYIHAVLKNKSSFLLNKILKPMLQNFRKYIDCVTTSITSENTGHCCNSHPPMNTGHCCNRHHIYLRSVTRTFLQNVASNVQLFYHTRSCYPCKRILFQMKQFKVQQYCGKFIFSFLWITQLLYVMSSANHINQVQFPVKVKS